MRCIRRKPLWLVEQQAEVPEHHKVYGLFSLLAVGVGGAVGSGIFVLSGAISKQAAGPATCLSWLIGGVICAATALAYAELSCIVPSSGSSYSFSFYALGEGFATLGAWFLTLEYGISGAAVSRSWGDKVAFYASELEVVGCSRNSTCWLNSLNGSSINVSAAFLCVLAVSILLGGVELGKRALNILVVLKVGLVIFVIVVGFQHFDRSNIEPFFPPPNPSTEFEGGMHGILFGTTIAFFGFVGFDEVCALTNEASKPHHIPIAVLGTISIITVLYVLASLALVGMVPYHLIDEEEGFGSAFRFVGVPWAVHIVMIGQILVVLPAVVLVSFLPQSRLLASVAQDGILPESFSRQDASGNLRWGIFFSGAVMTIIALLVPFRNLSELISGGILLAFNLSNCSILVIRTGNDARALRFVGGFVVLSCISAFFLSKTEILPAQIASAVLTVGYLTWLARFSIDAPERCIQGFSMPGVPFIPGMAILANWCLLAQLSWQGLQQVGILLLVAIVLYFSFVFCNLAYANHRLVTTADTDRKSNIDPQLNRSVSSIESSTSEGTVEIQLAAI